VSVFDIFIQWQWRVHSSVLWVLEARHSCPETFGSSAASPSSTPVSTVPLTKLQTQGISQDPAARRGILPTQTAISQSLSLLCTLRQLHSFLVVLTLLNLHTHSGARVIAAACHPLIHTTIVVTSLLTPKEPDFDPHAHLISHSFHHHSCRHPCLLSRSR